MSSTSRSDTPKERAAERDDLSDVPSSVAITGLSTFIGGALPERLARGGAGPRILGLDLHLPPRLAGVLEFQRLDLTASTASEYGAEILKQKGVDCVVHSAFRRFPTSDREYDHELETLGTLHLLAACVKAGVRHVVLVSSTMLYGPRPDNPHFLDEGSPLRGHADAHCVQNRIEAEQLVREFSERNPSISFTVLRPCWVMGPNVFDHVIEHFEGSSVTTVLGHDPLIQLVHEDDVLRVFESVVMEQRPGTFNIVGEGVLPLSTLIALAGKSARPLPMPLLRRLVNLRERRERGDAPAGFYDYLRYLWVADGERGWEAFGKPKYTTREAWISFIASRRLRLYR